MAQTREQRDRLLRSAAEDLRLNRFIVFAVLHILFLFQVKLHPDSEDEVCLPHLEPVLLARGPESSSRGGVDANRRDGQHQVLDDDDDVDYDDGDDDDDDDLVGEGWMPTTEMVNIRSLIYIQYLKK